MTRPSSPGDHNLDELFEKYREAPESYVFVPLADACRKIGRLEEALEICVQGVARHPGYASGHVVKGKCLYDQGDHDAARDAFERVLTLDDNNLVALKFLGMIEAHAGHLDVARNYLQKIIAIDPENKEIKDILRDVEGEQRVPGRGGGSEVAEGTDRAVESSIDGNGADEGVQGDKSDEYDEMASPGLEGIETSEELASITLADIFASQGYREKAVRIYEEVLKQQPGNEAVRKRLEELSADRRSFDGAHDGDDLAEVIDDRVFDASDETPEEPYEDTQEFFEDSEGVVSPTDPAESGKGTIENDFTKGTPDGVSDDAAAERDATSQSERPESQKPSQQEAEERGAGPAAPQPSEEADDADSHTDARRDISADYSINHFKRWLEQMQK